MGMNAVEREEVVQYREDRFLDFPGIGGISDDAHPGGEISGR